MKFLLVLVISALATCTWAHNLGRIVGGEDADPAQFSYAAAITVRTNDSRIFCGGAVIENQWVLTSAQCCDGADLFTIDLGSVSLTKTDPNRQTLATSEYFVHPDYNPLTLENDICLIRLRLAVEFSLYLNKIQTLGEYYVEEGTRLLAIGWGQTSDEDAGFSDNLQWVPVVSLSTEECQLTYGTQVNDNTLCVEGNYNEGSCYGDTGSPLILAMGRGSIHIAIASFISGNGCESSDPSGYIRTYPYVDWIRNYTQGTLP